MAHRTVLMAVMLLAVVMPPSSLRLAKAQGAQTLMPPMPALCSALRSVPFQFSCMHVIHVLSAVAIMKTLKGHRLGHSAAQTVEYVPVKVQYCTVQYVYTGLG